MCFTATRFGLPALMLIGLWGCSGSDAVFEAPAAGAWVEVAPTQCGGSPWERAGQPLDEFLEGLPVVPVEVSTDQFESDVCTSCACLTGERVCVLVDDGDLLAILDAGFERDVDGNCSGG